MRRIHNCLLSCLCQSLHGETETPQPLYALLAIALQSNFQSMDNEALGEIRKKSSHLSL
jgi:hypothetical protein